ncbi:hypothetical protein DMC47_33630 [Nostoc sp. 3335mG]|nr:hypothetical protein DMC47_33630 [Nostoc sp. 3335mG]
MAYLDLAAADAITGSYPSASSARSASRRLNSAERAAVLLARSDRPSSVAGTGYLGKVGEIVFGLRRPNRLADIRLEALRRFAIATAHNKARLAAWEANELRLLRYSEQEIGEASALAGQFRRPRASGSLTYALFALLLVGAFLWANRYLEDDVIALIAVAIVAIPFWAAVAPRKSGARWHR